MFNDNYFCADFFLRGFHYFFFFLTFIAREDRSLNLQRNGLSTIYCMIETN